MQRLTPHLKRELATFLILTFGLSSIFYVLCSRAGSLTAGGGLYVFLLMWCPGVSALATRLIYQHNVRGEGWKWGPTRYEIAGYLLPIVYAVVAYTAVWLTRLGGVDVSRFHGSAWRFIVFGTFASVLSALGEELGWRGFLVPKLAEGLTFTRTAIVVGVIWAAWHVPLIIGADYNGGTSPAYSIACFAIMVVAISFPLTWLRLRSRSVWPAVLLHASHNLFIQGFFDVVTVDTGTTKYMVGEFGAALAIVTAVTGYIFWTMRDRVPAPAT
jgi:membrane protease YdiL (CAAX protease family)